jgi:glucose/arabinose dehydrogenase
MNRIVRGGHYGWPDCSCPVPNMQRPIVAATARRRTCCPMRPLGMVFYSGEGFPAAFSNSLLIAFTATARTATASSL